MKNSTLIILDVDYDKPCLGLLELLLQLYDMDRPRPRQKLMTIIDRHTTRQILYIKCKKNIQWQHKRLEFS